MHIRLSSCIGLPIVEDGTDDVLGTVSGILIHPDTGAIEGFFVEVPRFLSATDLFLSSLDVLRWGTRIAVRSADVLCPLEDRIRLQPLLDDPRTVLDQRIVTEAGRTLGVCRDIQFSTDSMHIEWLFPKKLFRWGIALPVSEVKEVALKEIVVRDPVVKAEEEEAVKGGVDVNEADATLPELSDPSIPTPTTYQE